MGGGSTTDSHQTTTTELPQWVQDAGQANYGVAQKLANDPNPYYQGKTTAPTTMATNQAKFMAQDNMYRTNFAGQGLLNDINTYQPNIQTPDTIYAQQYAPALYNAQGYDASKYTAQGYGASTAAAAPTITAGQLAGTDLSPYMNPYVNDVVNKSMTQLNQQHDITANANAASAAAAGAFGGSRAAVQQGVADAQTAQNAGLLSSQLYGQAFDNAQQGAIGDINRRMQADTTNASNTIGVNEFNANAINNANAFTASANNTAGAFNASADNSAKSFNANANNTAAAFNANANNTAAANDQAAVNSMAQFNSSQRLAAQQAQDSAMRAKFGLQMSGINQLSANNIASSTELGQFGAAQQQTNQAALAGKIAQYNQNAAYPQQQLGLLESALGMTPYNTTTQSDGTVTKSQSPDFASIGMGMMKMFNPFGGMMGI